MMAHLRKKPTPDALDPVSRSLLPVLRYFLLGLQDTGHAGWQTAFGTAVEIWGEARGLAIAHRAQLFLSALLNSRPVPLSHSDPFCPEARLSLTDDECVLLALLSHMRDDEAPAARDMLAALTGGRIEAAVVRTGLDLCAVLDGTHGAQRGKGAPRLSVVS
ncbi:hypothetical protein GTA62_21155 [Roseobacter sp. HKCCD9010]|uniref:hypothetical protein n=2 Tax=unclassified Roseobacter TaxID=196798 RepID=UPI001490DC64|nr:MULTISPECIES: hypothetical protein [unclassified Roseobacter]MBF9052518.1 hypothetical protein [Rhodobacterales bacterium HKCCD4356]NNW60236.1 hypothetical protein [Roseobacter sp. HKCCD8629]NNY43376.1 hypothetical protein [Roseobacter sp. HKCCD8831]NOC68884.1 hypothetical protein [Roseobacter sp. HKCCD9021]NOD74444.1 hypothetical protein [Roseobacter sp. HKCCD7581]